MLQLLAVDVEDPLEDVQILRPALDVGGLGRIPVAQLDGDDLQVVLIGEP